MTQTGTSRPTSDTYAQRLGWTRHGAHPDTVDALEDEPDVRANSVCTTTSHGSRQSFLHLLYTRGTRPGTWTRTGTHRKSRPQVRGRGSGGSRRRPRCGTTHIRWELAVHTPLDIIEQYLRQHRPARWAEAAAGGVTDLERNGACSRSARAATDPEPLRAITKHLFDPHTGSETPRPNSRSASPGFLEREQQSCSAGCRRRGEYCRALS